MRKFKDYLKAQSDKELEILVRTIVLDFNKHNDVKLVVSDLMALIESLRK